jgi:hypothetical protein
MTTPHVKVKQLSKEQLKSLGYDGNVKPMRRALIAELATYNHTARQHPTFNELQRFLF